MINTNTNNNNSSSNWNSNSYGNITSSYEKRKRIYDLVRRVIHEYGEQEIHHSWSAYVKRSIHVVGHFYRYLLRSMHIVCVSLSLCFSFSLCFYSMIHFHHQFSIRDTHISSWANLSSKERQTSRNRNINSLWSLYICCLYYCNIAHDKIHTFA